MQRIVCCLLMTALLSACSTRQFVLGGVADALAAQGQSPEDDLQLAREASAFYLKLSESVLREQPAHAPLAVAVSSGFTQYAYAFVAFDAERLESTDAKAALRGRQRAARLYERALQHALAALQARQPALLQRLAEGRDPGLSREQVALAHWAATAWAALISLSKDQPERVAQLPQALRLAQAADALDPAHADGALASLLGTLEASRPGGSAALAQQHFDRARAAAAGRQAGVFVAEAEALASTDRPRFEALLRQAIGAAQQHRNLANEALRERAQWLLDTLDDRF
jgi:TRAP transporter T-component